MSASYGLFHEYLHVAEWGGAQGELRPSLKPHNPYLCRVQQLVRFRFPRLGSTYRRIESFNDQPNRQNHFLQNNGKRQENVAGNAVTAEQGQHASRHHQDDRDDTEARQPSGNEP